MVRKIVATLVEIGKGNIAMDFVNKAFDKQDSSSVPYKSLPSGLYLWKVYYK